MLLWCAGGKKDMDQCGEDYAYLYFHIQTGLNEVIMEP